MIYSQFLQGVVEGFGDVFDVVDDLVLSVSSFLDIVVELDICFGAISQVCWTLTTASTHFHLF